MTIWFSRTINGEKRHCSKSIRISFHPKHWRLLQCSTNGAIRGRKEDRIYDLNIYILGVFFGYTNWDYNWDIQ